MPGLSSFKNFLNQTASCGEIAFSLLEYFIFSHAVYRTQCSWFLSEPHVSCETLSKLITAKGTSSWSSSCYELPQSLSWDKCCCLY